MIGTVSDVRRCRLSRKGADRHYGAGFYAVVEAHAKRASIYMTNTPASTARGGSFKREKRLTNIVSARRLVLLLCLDGNDREGKPFFEYYDDLLDICGNTT
jgi:phosphomethylpyrimidine synthase